MGNEQETKLSAKENFIQFIKFTLFSISAGVIQTVSFTLLHDVFRTNLFYHQYWRSYIIALVLSVIYNFTINRRFTFKSTINIPIGMLKVFGYYCIFTPLSAWGGQELVDIGVHPYIVFAGTLVANFVTEYLFTRFVVYRNNINTRITPKPEEVSS